MSQYTINIGALPNDGTGDPLRTAFNEVNLNFNQVWATGLVNSNVQVANNTILTTNTNGNLVLAPNGVGVVQSNVSIVPNTSNIRSLGSGTQRWSSLYIQYANISGNLDLAGEFSVGDMTVTGNLTVTGNTIQIGNLITDAKTIQLANTASTANAANGSGMTVGSNDNIATILYSSTSNTWTTNIGISSVGNITAPYLFGNGSQLTGLPASYSNANVVTLLAGFGSNTVSTTGNITGNYFIGNGSLLTSLTGANVTGTVANATSATTAGTVTGNAQANITSVGTLTSLSSSGNVTGGNVLTGGVVSAAGNVTGNYILGNGSQLTGIVSSYGNANVVANLANLGSNPVSSTGNITGAYILGNGSQLTSLPAPAVTQDITSNGAMSIMTYDGVIKYVSYATVEPSSGNIAAGNISTTGVVTATGNITGNYFIGNGSQLTGISADSNKIFNGNSYANIASADGNLVVNVGNDGYGIWTFAAGTGNLVGPGNASQGAGIVFSADQSVYIREDMGELKIDAGSDIVITTNSGNVGNTESWTFDAVGNLTIPGNILGSGNILIAPDSASSSSYLDIYLTGGPDIHIASNDNSIVIGRDTGANIFVGNDGEVSIRTDNGVTAQVWDFDNVGNLTVPGGMIINGNINTLGTQTALLQPTDNLPLSFIASGANGSVTSFWAEDFANLMTSNIAAIYTPLQNTQTVRIVTGSNGGNIAIYDFDKDGMFTAAAVCATGNVYAGNVSASGNVTGGNLITAGSGGAITLTGGNITGANVVTANAVSTTGNITSGNILTGGLISAAGNISANNLSLAGNITSNIGFTGSTITINNSPGGVEGAEIQWALPAVANTSLSGTFVQDVYANGMRFFESSGNTRGLYMDLGNAPNGSTTAVGYRDIPQVAFTANTTIATTDAGRHYYSTLSTGNVLTIANNASQGFQVGAAITIVNQGTGNITVAQGSGVTLYLAGNATSGNRTVATFGMATMIKVATDTWFINGTGVS